VNRVGLVHEETYFWHTSRIDFGPDVEGDVQLETPEPRRRLLNLLHRTGLSERAVRLRAHDLTREDLVRVHTPEYVDGIAAANGTGGDAGELTPFGPGSYDIARLSAGGVYAAFEGVLSGGCDSAFALVRPPGHHAERDRGRGYCVFANIAVAAEKARAEGLARRVAVIDWDVHHGNGTQWIYYDDPDTLTVSLHQDRLYPHDSGMVDEVGGPGAEGANVNVPLPAGTGIGGYLHAWDTVVAPAVRAFRPDVVVIACGFDASAFDPNARMLITAGGFRTLTERALDLAAEVCEGRLVMVQEGGYSPFYVPICGAAVIEKLLGEEPGVVDSGAFMDGLPDQELQPHQQTAVAAALVAWQRASLGEPVR
jgi:acetoin utilization deacetylase AcuC-like enzyme